MTTLSELEAVVVEVVNALDGYQYQTKSMVSATDTLAEFLQDKIQASDNIVIEKVSDGGVEHLTIRAVDQATTIDTGGDHLVFAHSDDTTPGYLNGKVIAGDGIEISKQGTTDGSILITATDQTANMSVELDGYDVVSVSASDILPEFLEEKIISGDNCTITRVSVAGVEHLRLDVINQISATNYVDGYGKAKVSASDLQPNYLSAKLIAGPNIRITQQSVGGIETLLFDGEQSIVGEKVEYIEDALDGYALLAIEDQRWIDSSTQRQDLRDAADGYSAQLDIFEAKEDQRWIDSSTQRQDIRDVLDGYVDQDLSPYALLATENQRWLDSSEQLYDLRISADGYLLITTHEEQVTIEDQRWVDSSTQRQELRDAADGYFSQIEVFEAKEDQRWTDSSQQRQDLRDAADGYIETDGGVVGLLPIWESDKKINYSSQLIWNEATNLLTVGDGTVESNIAINGPEATRRRLRFMTSGSPRWMMGVSDVESETGSDVGSNFSIVRFDDAGGFLGVPIAIGRSTGNVTIEDDLLVSGRIHNSILGEILDGYVNPDLTPYATVAVEDQRWVDSSTQRQDIRDSLDGYTGDQDLSGYATLAIENQRWSDSSEQRQDIRDVLDGYVDQDLSSYAILATEDQRWVDSSTQRQDLRNAADGYALGGDLTGIDGQVTNIQNSLDGYALDSDLTTLDTLVDEHWLDSSSQRQDLRNAADGYALDADLTTLNDLVYEQWINSSEQRQDLRNAADGYLLITTDDIRNLLEDQRWLDSSTQRQDIRDSLDGYVNPDLSGYAILSIENQRWNDSSTQRQDLRVAADGYLLITTHEAQVVIEDARYVEQEAQVVIEDQRWVDSSGQRQDIRDTLDGYATMASVSGDIIPSIDDEYVIGTGDLRFKSVDLAEDGVLLSMNPYETWQNLIIPDPEYGVTETYVGSGSTVYDPSDTGQDGRFMAMGAPNAVASLARFDTAVPFIDNTNHRIRMLNYTTRVATDYAGNGNVGFASTGTYRLDCQMPAFISGVTVKTYGPSGLNDVYFSDPTYHHVRFFDSGLIFVQVGNAAHRGTFYGDGGLASDCGLNYPAGLVHQAGGEGRMYLCDRDNHRIRTVNGATGIIDTVAGSGSSNYFLDAGGDPLLSGIGKPEAITFLTQNIFLVASPNINRVIQVDLGGPTISLFAGNGTAGSAGDGGQATSAQLDSPSGVASDDAGNVFISCKGSHTIRMVEPSGVIHTISGTADTPGYVDATDSEDALFDSPRGMTVIPGADNLLIADEGNDRIRSIVLGSTTVEVWTTTGLDREYNVRVNDEHPEVGPEQNNPALGSLEFMIDGYEDPIITVTRDGNFQVNANISSNLIPATDNIHTLGTLTNRWKKLYVGPGSIHVNSIEQDKDFSMGVSEDGGSSGNYQLKSEDTEILTATSDGDVGFGVESPTAKVDVDGGVKSTALTMTTAPKIHRTLSADLEGNASWELDFDKMVTDKNGEPLLDEDYNLIIAPSGNIEGARVPKLSIFGVKETEDQRWLDSSQQRQDIRDSLDGYSGGDAVNQEQVTAIQDSLDGYALEEDLDDLEILVVEHWIDATTQLQDLRDAADGYTGDQDLSPYAFIITEDKRWLDSSEQRQDIRDSLDGYVNPDLSGYALGSELTTLETKVDQNWVDSSTQRQDIRDVLDGYIDTLEIQSLENQTTDIQNSLDGYVNPDLTPYALIATEDQRWTDSSSQRQDIRDSLDGYVDQDLTPYALVATENQRWLDSSEQLQDLRDAADGYTGDQDLSPYAILATENERWVDSSTQRQDIRDSLDGYVDQDLSTYAILEIENQRWVDSSTQRQDIRDILDGYIDELEIQDLEDQTTDIQNSLDGYVNPDLSPYALVATEDQRWSDSSQQRQDIRDSLDGYVDQDLSPYAFVITVDQHWTDSSQQRQDIRDSLDGYVNPDLSGYALDADLITLETKVDEHWVDSSEQRQDIRDSLDGYTGDQDLGAYALDADLITLDTKVDDHWSDSSEQRQDIRDSLDGYVDQDLTPYALITTEDQRWVDSSTQRQDIRDVLDGYVDQDLSPYAFVITVDQNWSDSSEQRQDLRDAADGYTGETDLTVIESQVTDIQNSLDGYVNPDLSGYALLATENQRWVDSSTQRQDIRDVLDGYVNPDLSPYALVVTEDQRWVDSSEQRQDLRDAADGYAQKVHLHTRSDRTIDTLGSPTATTLLDYYTATGSAGITSGGEVLANGDGTISVMGGRGFIRADDGYESPLLSFDFEAESKVSVVDHATNFIYIAYNDGSPQIAVYTSHQESYGPTIHLANVYRNDNILSINAYVKHDTPSATRRLIRRMEELHPMERVYGGNVSDEGSLAFSVSGGRWFETLNEYYTTTFDSSGADQFYYLYRDGSSGWTVVPYQDALDSEYYDDGTGTLAVVSNQKYSNHWIFMATDSRVAVLYGQEYYTVIADAEKAGLPATLPSWINTTAALVAKIITKNGQSEIQEILSPFTESFALSGGVSNHAELFSLQGGVPGQYYHLTSAELDLLDEYVLPTGPATLGDGALTIDSDGYITCNKAIHTATGDTYTPVTEVIIDLSLANSNVIDLNSCTGNCNITLAGGVAGGRYILKIINHSGAAKTVSWEAEILFSGGDPATVTATAGAIDVFDILYDGEYYVWMFDDFKRN